MRYCHQSSKSVTVWRHCGLCDNIKYHRKVYQKSCFVSATVSSVSGKETTVSVNSVNSRGAHHPYCCQPWPSHIHLLLVKNVFLQQGTCYRVIHFQISHGLVDALLYCDFFIFVLQHSNNSPINIIPWRYHCIMTYCYTPSVFTNSCTTHYLQVKKKNKKKNLGCICGLVVYDLLWHNTHFLTDFILQCHTIIFVWMKPMNMTSSRDGSWKGNATIFFLIKILIKISLWIWWRAAPSTKKIVFLLCLLSLWVCTGDKREGAKRSNLVGDRWSFEGRLTDSGSYCYGLCRRLPSSCDKRGTGEIERMMGNCNLNI